MVYRGPYRIRIEEKDRPVVELWRRAVAGRTG